MDQPPGPPDGRLKITVFKKPLQFITEPSAVFFIDQIRKYFRMNTTARIYIRTDISFVLPVMA